MTITLPDSLVSIGDAAFGGCYHLIEVINFSGLTIVPGDDSNGGISLYAISVHKGESKIKKQDDCLFYTSNGKHYLFRYTGSKTELTLPENYKGKTYAIYDYAFARCNLTSVVIPDCVTAIGDYAFDGCPIYNVHIGNGITSIGYLAFSYCEFTSIFIPEGVTSIGDRAFEGCPSLKSIIIPDGMINIGKSAFWGCSSLKSIVIPAGVTSVGEYAFAYCALTDIYCEAERRPAGWDINWSRECDAKIHWGYKGN